MNHHRRTSRTRHLAAVGALALAATALSACSAESSGDEADNPGIKTKHKKAGRRRGPLAGLEDPGRDHIGRRADRLRHRHRSRGDLLPRRPVREGRAADGPRRGGRAVHHLGRLLRCWAAVRRRGARHRVVRRLRRHRASDDQPGRVRLRGPGQQRRRRRQLRGQGGLRRGHLQQGARHRPHPVERGLDQGLPERRLRHHGLPARAGSSVSSRGTPPVSPAGTSPMSSPEAAATGVAPT